MTARLRWFCLGILTVMEIIALYFAFSNLGSPWSSVWLWLNLLLGSVDMFLLLQLPYFSFSEKQKKRLQKTQLRLCALAILILPLAVFGAREKQAHRAAVNIEISRLQAETKRIETQNAQLDAEAKRLEAKKAHFDMREKSR